MNAGRLVSIIAAAMLVTAGAAVTQEQSFLVQTAGDLADLCGPPSDDNNRVAAIHMCEGYIIGAHHFHTAVTTNTQTNRIYCLPEKGMPSRDEIAAEFASWIRNSPQAAKLPAIEGFMRWAASRFPCS